MEIFPFTDSPNDINAINSSHFVELKTRYELSGAIATLIEKDEGQSQYKFGGVIFTKGDNDSIHSIEDLKDKRISAVSKNSLGGYQASAYELYKNDIDLDRDVSFVFTGMPHAKAVNLVLDGSTDIKIIQPISESSFNQMLSTELYPEWPFAAATHVDIEISRAVASALLMIKPEYEYALKMDIYGFNIPSNYLIVEELMRALKLPPFDQSGVMTLEEVWGEYYLYISSLIVVIFFLFLTMIVKSISERKIKKKNKALNEVMKKLKENQEKIEYLSYHDPLTGLYNRRFYEEKLKEYELRENFPVSLIVIDVNGLKLTNDAFGHEAGDRLLIKVAEHIKKSCRDEDIVSRISGDEFVVLLKKTDHIGTEFIINRMIEITENEKNGKMPISISSGWATKKNKQERMESVFKRAEDMMYHNKSAERNSLRHQSIQIIMQTLIEKTPREEAHSKRVSDLCFSIAKEMGMDSTKAKYLQTAGLLHDIGKIGVSNEVLDKIGVLGEEEWLSIKKHPQTSYNILSTVNNYGPLADIVLSHHERWDGRGYPNGLKGEEIPLEARIIAIADAYDAMISDRPYRQGMEKEKVLKIIEGEAGKQFDPAIVSIFLSNVIKINVLEPNLT